ncbi:sperm flagellar protein 1-like [Amphibalanus amphitrite]|uniref:sperm flagellar protein 1-like n=1 Tax=Amphibalanus amphitrite TaxID=1232801 RepID=UPI001C8FC49B|nr:sperm flagellar protein 1-like [Amphibalanus amphitrite]
MQDELERAQFEEVYVWVDDIPLSRPRRNIHRDFSDGCMFAEVVQYFVPRLIELHNYIPANSVKQKRQNWDLLWRKVLPKFGIRPSDVNTDWLVQAKPGAIEKLLYLLKTKLEESDGRELNDSSSVNQSVTPPTSERLELSQTDVSPRENPADGATPDHPDSPGLPPTAPLAAGTDNSRPAAAPAATSASVPVSQIPVKRIGVARGGPTPGSPAELARRGRSRLTPKSSPTTTPAIGTHAQTAERNRLRQLVIEQTEQIAVLKARCCKLEQLLQLRDDQLRQLGGGEPE